MSKKKVLVIVPFPLDELGMENRRLQLESVEISSDITFDYRGVKASPALYDSQHDYVLADLSILEAGMTAQDDGYDAVCIDTMSDSGMNALRSVLDIPVIGPGRASFHTALMFADNFSVITQWDPWKNLYKKTLREYGLEHKCVSIKSINVPPDVSNLLGGKEEDVFPKLLAACEEAIAEGAQSLMLGSTTMHQSHAWLAERVSVPIINPGPLTYKLAELALALNFTHSRPGYLKPNMFMGDMITAMLEAGAKVQQSE